MKKNLYALLLILFSFATTFLPAQSFENNQDQFSTLNPSNIEIQLAIYPQPSNGRVNLTFGEAQSETPSIMVFDILGNVIIKNGGERLNQNTFILDLSDRKPGYYFVRIQTEKGNISRRITIKP